MWMKIPSGKKGKNFKDTIKVKKVKDPNAPKKPPNAYFLFLTEMREQMKKKVEKAGEKGRGKGNSGGQPGQKKRVIILT